MTKLKTISRLLFIAMLIPAINLVSHADQDQIVAYVNNEIITSYDLQNRITLLESVSKTKISSKGKQEILQTLIDENLLNQIARRNGISISEQQIQSSIKTIAKDNGFSDFAKLAKHYNINQNEFLKELKAKLLMKKLIEVQIEPDTKVSNEEVLDNMNAISGAIVQPTVIDLNGEVKISEIVLYKQQMEQKDMLQAINNIYAQLQKGASFEELAKQFSQSQSAQNGGLIGWMKLSQLSAHIAAGIENGLGNFKTGRVVKQPIELEDRVVLIKVLDTKQKKIAPKKLTEQEVKGFLYNQKVNSNLKNFLNNLRKTAYISIKKA